MDERMKNVQMMELNNILKRRQRLVLTQVKAPIRPGVVDEIVIMEIDVQGGAQVAKKVPDSIRIFVLPPTMQVLDAKRTKNGMNVLAVTTILVGDNGMPATLDELRKDAAAVFGSPDEIPEDVMVFLKSVAATGGDGDANAEAE